MHHIGVVVIEIDCNVSAVAAAFGFLQDLLSRFFKTKPCTPAAHVVAASAAERKEFIPVLFHKEQNPADDIFLFCLVISKGISIDVNVQTASRCLMGTIAHGNCLPKEFLPVHGFHVIIQCHGMGNDLKAIFQRTIRLDVNVFLMHIGDAFEAGGVVIVLTAFIHFQFYAEVSFSVSVENGCGLVTVLFDLILKLVKASFAVGQVAVPADETFRNDLPAGFAAVVVGIEAVLTKAGVFIGDAVLFPDSFTAVVTGDTVFLNAVIAEQFIVYRCTLFLRKHSSAVVANSYFFHFKFLQKQKFR